MGGTLVVVADAGRVVAAVARRQHGLVTRAQALEAGVARTTWHRMVDRVASSWSTRAWRA